jgi:maltose O-acetyltransferase
MFLFGLAEPDTTGQGWKVAMTEKEKMLSSALYHPMDPELIADRASIKRIIHRFNTMEPDLVRERHDLIRPWLASPTEHFHIEPPFHCDYGYNISIGENSYINYNLTVLDCGKVTIGKNAFIGPNVSIYTPNHTIDANLRNSGVETAFPVTIGDNVWLGGSVTILPGVTIGDNVVIGAGSVVTKDIPSHSVAVGNPCRVVKKLSSDV